MTNELERTMRMNYLLDFYRGLLTDKQKSYMERYYLDDESLTEIAETFNVSRQAVYDNIRRTDDLLEEYEMKLGLFQKFEARSTLLEQLKSTVESDEALKLIEQIENIE